MSPLSEPSSPFVVTPSDLGAELPNVDIAGDELDSYNEFQRVHREYSIVPDDFLLKPVSDTINRTTDLADTLPSLHMAF